MESYFAYWGKARPGNKEGPSHHLLPYHALDVAACALALAEEPRFGFAELASSLALPLERLKQLFVYFAALHDLGKFAIAFQRQVPELAPEVAERAQRRPLAPLRHDTLGWVLWLDSAGRWGCNFEADGAEREEVLVRLAAGHHGRPPQENFQFGRHPRAADYFQVEGLEAAGEFVRDVRALFLPDGMPPPDGGAAVHWARASWRMAGLVVLADWLGSNAEGFPYRNNPMALRDYWEQAALPQARAAVKKGGLRTHRSRGWSGAQSFLGLERLTALQGYAAKVELSAGPQLFLLEDVTGAGKTEAAFILAHRLMAAGLVQGLYYALPTMATANQMYDRTAALYGRLFAEGEEPSLILAHSARRMNASFRNSILADAEAPAERDARGEPPPASAQLNAWLADSGKKALLADVGVGTVDQVLLGVLPVRHQSLRLLGLAGKVLIVDEVHAYDSYMSRLLEVLVEAQAAQGGSVVLLSATVPAALRVQLLAAFARGGGWKLDSIASDLRYPLITQLADGALRVEACATRAELERSVTVHMVHCEEDVVERMKQVAQRGRCACWIRNTVEDARRGYELLLGRGAGQVGLFHSRYVTADRLAIEGDALHSFGKFSGPEERRGRLLVATQVVEQSLDLDFDEMFVDLAPIDLIIQRAGRLRRHPRRGDGSRLLDGADERGAVTLHLLCPEWQEEPEADWYSGLFPKAQFVYPNVGILWRTQRVLMEGGRVVTPGQPRQMGGVRWLIESVYGEDAAEIPPGLVRGSREAEGRARAEEGLASFNAIEFDAGYCETLTGKWYEESRVATRLSEEGLTLYLAREVDGRLGPFYEVGFGWEMSAVRVNKRNIGGLAAEWEERFGGGIAMLRKHVRLLEGDAVVLPLEQCGGAWVGQVLSGGKEARVRYTKNLGLVVESVH